MVKAIIIFILATISYSPVLNTGKVILEITNLESSDGKILISVFDIPDDFPRKAENAYMNLTSRIENKSCFVEIDLSPGVYAISVAHDENDNGRVDTNFLGIPNEPLGMSNYPEKGRPNFDKAKFTIGEGDTLKFVIPVDTIF